MGQQCANKHAYLLRQVCLLLTLLMLAISCEEDKEPSVYPPTLTTNSATELSRFGATCLGTVVKNPNSVADLKVAFLYSTSASLTNATEVEASAESGNNYKATIQGLSPGVQYYYCIIARSGNSITKGKITSFSTSDALPPSLSIAEAIDVTESGVSLAASVIDNGGYEPTIRGFAYAIYIEGAAEPDINSNTQLVLDSEFKITLKELQANTTYIVRPYATSDAGTGYGESIRFTTSQQKSPILIANGIGALAGKPVITTAYSADVIGGVTENHGFTIQEYGFTYSTESRQPTVESSQKVIAVNGSTRFSSTLEKLLPNTKYYLRAYARSEKGYGYSATVEFSTEKEQVVSLTQATVTALTSSSATIVAQMAYEAFTVVKEKGVCYGTEVNPTVSNTKIVDTNAQKSVTATINGLKESGNYHARAYAITRDGTFYSGNISFNTETTYKPTLGKVTIYDKTETGAKVKSSISTNGGLTVSKRGFYYNTANSKEPWKDGVEIVATDVDNNITAALSALQGGITYYICAFATNAKGTGYSLVEQLSTAQHTVPALSSLNVSGIGDDNAQASANLTNVGGEGEVISERGFVIATYNEPVIDGYNTIKIVSSESKDVFSARLTGLSYSTLYNIRAYATNKVGTGYSNMLSFETGTSTTAAISELACTKIEHYTLSFSFNVNNNGGAEITTQGFEWHLSTDYSVTGKVTGIRTGNVVTGTVTGLKENSTYSVHGFVINKNGTTTTNYSSFTTAKLPPSPGDNTPPGDNDGIKKPSVGYVNVTNIHNTYVRFNAMVENDNGATVTQKGFLWCTSDKNPATEGTKIIITGGNNMIYLLSGLKSATSYRVCAFATNAKGTTYSNTQYFTTESDKDEPGGGDNPPPSSRTRSKK